MFIWFCLPPSYGLIRGEQSNPFPLPPLHQTIVFPRILEFSYHRTTTCTPTLMGSKRFLLRRNEARLSQKGMGGSWCCELGEIGGRVTQPLEGASLRVETGSLGDFCKWQTNPMPWTEDGQGISLHPGHLDMTDPSICEKIPVLGNLTE